MEIYCFNHKLTLCDKGSFDTENPTIAFDWLETGRDVVLKANLRDFIKCVHDRYVFVKAAGGVVQNADGDLLVIHREGQWDLPKGMVEKGETLAMAALREVAEETGVHHCHITGSQTCPMTKTYHIYNKYGGWHLKQTSWFPMSVVDTHISLTPQQEEGIDICQWEDVNSWKALIRQSFPSLRQLTALV